MQHTNRGWGMMIAMMLDDRGALNGTSLTQTYRLRDVHGGRRGDGRREALLDDGRLLGGGRQEDTGGNRLHGDVCVRSAGTCEENRAALVEIEGAPDGSWIFTFLREFCCAESEE